MRNEELKLLAGHLDRATLEAREVDKLTANHPQLSLSHAYKIQDLGIQLRQSRGEKVVGYKMGLTSKAKMKQMGVDSPIYGILTDKMQLFSGQKISLQGRIHPKIEPEIAFLMASDLKGKVSAEKALESVGTACAAMEIIDSRYLNFNFTLNDVVADNCSSSAFILGPIIKKPADILLANLGMVLEINGKSVEFGSSSAILGSPAESLAALSAMLDERGHYISKGSIILAGAATQAVSLSPGMEVRTQVQDLDSVSIRIE